MAKSKTPRRGKKALVRNPETKAALAELGAVHCTIAEVAEHFGATEIEVRAFLGDWNPGRNIYEDAAADARKRLRVAQLKLAEKSPTMAIFLGRQYLGQAERRELDASARAAETAADAEFVRAALAALAADRGAPGDLPSAEDGEPGEPAGAEV
jgi:hypothetical protein